MRVLLDESLPRRLARELTGHTVETVTGLGWSGTKNGELLKKAAAAFDVFVTPDQNLKHQQNLNDLPVAVIVLKAKGNDLPHLLPAVPALLQTLHRVRPRELVELDAPEPDDVTQGRVRRRS